MPFKEEYGVIRVKAESMAPIKGFVSKAQLCIMSRRATYSALV